MKNFVLILSLLSIIGACTPKTRPFIEHHAFEISVKNRKYAKGYDNGFKEGKEKGLKDGYQKGYAEAKALYYEQGVHDGYLEAIEAAKAKKIDMMPDKIAQAYFDKYGERCGAGGALSTLLCIEQKVLSHHKRKMDTLPYFQNGFNKGFNVAFDSIFSPLAIMDRQIVSINESDIDKLFIDYDSSVVLKVKDIALSNSPQSNPQNLDIFRSALYEVHKNMLRYVANRVNLGPSETEEMYKEYDKIHLKLSSTYYQYFLRIIESENINLPNTGFYNFKLYHNINAFMEVVNAGACSMVDLIFTYVKKNPLYASVYGLDNMGNGHICQILIEEVLKKFRINTERIALGYDYQIVRPEIEVSLRQTLFNSVIETRIVEYPKPFKAKVKANDGSEVVITMQLYAFVGLGLQQETILLSHTLSNNSSNLIVNISDVPYLLPQFFHVGYKILNTDVTIEYATEINKTTNRYSIWNLPSEGISASETKTVISKKTVSIDEFEKVFQAHKEEASYENVSAHLKKSVLSQSSVVQFRSIVLKVIEPALSLPNSRYKAYLNFGSSSAVLINTID